MSHSGSIGSADIDRSLPFLLWAVKNCDVDRHRLDAQGIQLVRLHDGLHKLHNRHGFSRDTVVGAWIKRWMHYQQRGVDKCKTSSLKTD